MRRIALLAGIAVALPHFALAREGPAPAPAASSAGVVTYPGQYFQRYNPATALDMVQRLPGFSFDLGANVRGFSGSGGNVLINGERPASKSDPLDEILRRTPALAVERIELIHAGDRGVDMQGRSVLANVVLKKAARVERTLNLSTYIYPDGYLGPTFEYQTSRSEGDKLLEGSIKYYTDRTDLTSDDASRTRRLGPAVVQDADLSLWDHMWGTAAKGAVQRGLWGGKIRFNGLIENNAFNRNEEAVITVPSALTTHTAEDYSSWKSEVGGQLDHDFGERLSGELIVLQRLEKELYNAGGEAAGATSAFHEDSLSGETIVRGQLSWRHSDALSWKGGAEGAYNFLDDKTAYEENGVAVPLPAASVRVEEVRGEAFGSASWRPTKTLSLEAGSRIEVSTISQSGDTELTKSFVYVKPRLAMVWSPTADDKVRLRIEREVGQLNFGDFVASAGVETGTVDGGNPDLEPQRSWVVEAAYERRFWTDGALVVLARHTELTDVVDRIPVAGFDSVGNIGDGVSNLLRLDLTAPLGRLGIPGGQFKGFASWVDSTVTDPATLTERRISGQVPRTCEAHFTQDIPGGVWSWGAGAYCATVERYFRFNEIRTFTTEAQLETFVQWRPSPDLTIRLDWQNMTARVRARERIIYDGPRGTGPLLYAEDRPIGFDSWLWLRIRKAL